MLEQARLLDCPCLDATLNTDGLLYKMIYITAIIMKDQLMLVVFSLLSDLHGRPQGCDGNLFICVWLQSRWP